MTFWHNVLMAKMGYFNYCLNILWSLSVEEIFYIAFPIVCLIFKKTRLIALFLIALMVIAPIYRNHYDHNETVAVYGYLSCFDAIAIGCCAAMIARKIQFRKWIGTISQYAAGLLLVSVYLYSGIMQNVVFGFSLMAIGTAILLITASREGFPPKNSTNIIAKIIRWFGKNSYELYLFHIIILAFMKEICGPESLGNYTKLLWMAVFFLASALLAGGIAKFYSQPINKRLREILFRLRRPLMLKPNKENILIPSPSDASITL